MGAAVVVLFAVATVMWRRNRLVAVVALLIGTLVGLLFLNYLGMDAFCVPPPGSGCA
jgi:hypothetical protein